MPAFGPMLRAYRLRAGLGLRTFAGLVDARASTVSAIESGRRAPWRRQEQLHRVADVLGLVVNSPFWKDFSVLAEDSSIQPPSTGGQLKCWRTGNGDAIVNASYLPELAEFVGADPVSFHTEGLSQSNSEPLLPQLTELSIEWHLHQVLGRYRSQKTPLPVDVEAALEKQAGVRLEIMPGLIPRFSVAACIVQNGEETIFCVDRIVADSRPTASYRNLLAQCYAPLALWSEFLESDPPAQWFFQLQHGNGWNQAARDCRRFALAMLLPATAVWDGAETAYRELINEQGWVDTDDAILAVRNRLAEQFAVPTSLVHRRLVGWPCHLYGRIAQALEAQELTLPPADWIGEERNPRQKMLFDTKRPQRT